MSQVFLVSVLVLESDKDARVFFHGKNAHDLKTLAGGQVQFFIPDTIEDAFSAKGVQRYPNLERADLSCLWAEDQTKAHFKIHLEGKSSKEIREILSDLGDAAQNAASLLTWRADFERRRAKRSAAPPGVPAQQRADGERGGQANGSRNPDLVGNQGKTEAAGKDRLTGEGALLVRLGQIAGLAGIGAGVFFMLFAKLTFPALEPEQANLFMLLAYGFGVLTSAASAARSPDGRFTSLLLASLGVVLALIGAFALQPSDTSAYTVQLTLRSPNGSLVDSGKIWCSPLCTPKSVSGGWEISVPPESAKANSKLTINAEVPARGWRAKADVSLGKNRLIPLDLLLEKGGELMVSGVVVDAAGAGIPNVRVGRYGEDPVSTDANGGFRLSTNEGNGTEIKIRATSDNPRYAPAEKNYVVGSGELQIELKDAKDSINVPIPSARSDQSKGEQTGDSVIDRVLANLASLKRNGRTPAESELSNALAPLFSRPAFYGIREEDWRYFLYALCRTRLLLEKYVGEFRSQPKVRDQVSQAIQKMVALQNRAAALYGPTFSVSQHIDRYIANKKLFVEHLPTVIGQADEEFYRDRDREIREIVDLLRNAGFPINR